MSYFWLILFWHQPPFVGFLLLSTITSILDFCFLFGFFKESPSLVLLPFSYCDWSRHSFNGVCPYYEKDTIKLWAIVFWPRCSESRCY